MRERERERELYWHWRKFTCSNSSHQREMGTNTLRETGTTKRITNFEEHKTTSLSSLKQIEKIVNCEREKAHTSGILLVYLICSLYVT